ncbi:reticulon-1-like isoform X2 [Sinocyclocheilus anshuiensis]|uniref:reticulon-1-like isoform X1 n=1 Tax=Sinocyclocheilus anshuiensis TaxID=1608454 RepID=UPI0007BA2BCF|nr:PREDICTED: reticulon-1-like isoform X1 [Sinocyclocheilus anshuiensis]XP_016323197.1 PREDICTED: reticulon-1-like isoform X2 [Sinocyclocheilus anshuiensis]
MSANSSEGPGLDGKWFEEEEEEKNGMFGSAGPRFDEMRDGVHAPKQQFHRFEGRGVAMETASTGDSLSDMFMKSSSGEGDLYTSLLSSKSSSNPFNDGASLFSTEGNRSPPAPTGTDSGIGMTPGDPSDHQTTLQGSHKTDHYSYMDMGDDLCDFGSVGNTKNKQQPPMSGYGDDEEDEDDIQDFKPKIHEKESSHDPFDLGRYLEKSPLGSEDTGVKSPGSAGGQHAFPYMEDPSDEEMADYRSYHRMETPQSASPVKITVTTESQPVKVSPQGGMSERESVLSFGQQGLPIVTLSEPEDDSAASSANHSPNHSPTGRESPSDVLFQPAGMKSVSSTQDSSGISSHPSLPEAKDIKSSAKPSSPWAQDLQGSGDESGDSEIEQVTEESDSPIYDLTSKTPPAKGGFSQVSNPFEQTSYTSATDNASNPFDKPQTNKVSASNLFDLSGGTKGGFGQSSNPPIYSLLREEREAELDSDLLIESASEESPKREQEYSAPKPPEISSPLTTGVTSSKPITTSCATASPFIDPPDSTSKETEKEKEKEKEKAAPVEKPKPQPEDSWSTKPRPAVMGTSTATPEQHSSQEKENKSKSSIVSSTTEKEADLSLFLQSINRQKVMGGSVVDLLHWRDLKQSGLVFGSVLLLLFSLTQFSVVSVIAYLALAVLSATISFRVYKSVLQAVQKTDEGHPFKAYLEVEIDLSADQIIKYVDKTQLYINSTMKELRRLFLVQDMVDSIKFAVLMWLLTYVGALFNGLTLLILVVVSMFSVPVVYEKYQTQIDQYLGLVRTQFNSIMGKVREKVPGAKKKE